MRQIARLRVTLNHISPKPMRQVEVPLNIRLDQLHDVMQAAMGWWNCHLYEFRVGEFVWGMVDMSDLFEPPEPANKTTLKEVMEGTGTKRIQYIYDFGDDWDHSISIQKIIKATPGTKYPRLLKATGACPPEDVGGTSGYGEFLEAMADPDHEEHEEYTVWCGGHFDPEDPKIGEITTRLASLALQWAPQPRKTRKPKEA